MNYFYIYITYTQNRNESGNVIGRVHAFINSSVSKLNQFLEFKSDEENFENFPVSVSLYLLHTQTHSLKYRDDIKQIKFPFKRTLTGGFFYFYFFQANLSCRSICLNK